MKSITKYLLIAASCLCLAGTLAGCGDTAQSNEIRLGTNLELSGAGMPYSASTQKGVELAIEELNNQGGLLGKEIRLITTDNHSEENEAVRNMKLLEDAKVSAVIGPNLTRCAMSVTKEADKDKIPVISPAGSYPGITADPETHEVYPYMFRATFIDSVQGRAMAQFAYKTLHVQKAAVLYDPDSAYASGLATFFREGFIAAGGTVTAFEFDDPTMKDFTDVLRKIQESGAEVLYIPAYYWQALPIARQARAAGIKIPLLGCDGWDNGEFLSSISHEVLQPIYFTNHYGMDIPDDRSEKFIEAYTKRYKAQPDIYAALGYDAVMMVADAIKRGDSEKAVKVAEELGNTIQYPGITGDITLDANHDAVKDVAVLTCLGGTPLLVEKIPGN